jgi:hypothetical protein
MKGKVRRIKGPELNWQHHSNNIVKLINCALLVLAERLMDNGAWEGTEGIHVTK